MALPTAELAELRLPDGRRVGDILPISLIARPNGTGRVPARLRPPKPRRRVYSWEKSSLSGHSTETPARARDCWLVEAAQEMQLERVQALLALPHTKVDRRRPKQDTALMAIARSLGRDAERDAEGTGHLDADTREWVRQRHLDILDALLAKGANPMLVSGEGKTVPELMGGHIEALRRVFRAGHSAAAVAAQGLYAALARGDTTTAAFWLRRQKDQAAWPNPVEPVVEALVPLKPLAGLSSLKRPRLSRPQALRWLRRLRRAGFSLDRPLAPPPLPKKKPDATRWGLDRDEDSPYKVDDTQDTPLVRVARRHDAQAVRLLLGEGAQVAWAPNGRHPFMAWLKDRWSGDQAGFTPETVAIAERFFATDLLESPLLKREPERGAPTFEDTHPLGAIMNGMCRSRAATTARLGWQWAHRLIDCGLSCPLPDEKTVSAVERIAGWFLHDFQWRRGDDKARETEACRELARFLHALPGWRAAQATPCKDRNRFHLELIEALAYRGSCPERILERLTETGLSWGSEAGYVDDIVSRQVQRPLPYLCTLRTYRDQPAEPEKHPLNPQAIGFLVGRHDTPQDDKDAAFDLLLQWPERPQFAESLKAFWDNGFSLSAGSAENPSPIERAVTAAKTTPEVLRIFFDLDVRHVNPSEWPEPLKSSWLSWVAEEAEQLMPQPKIERARARL